MYLIRQRSPTKLPISRKGTKYLARALSHVHDSVPVVIAVRDMLGIAKTAKEVREMIKLKLLKINGRPVRDYRESVRLFNVLEAEKNYVLSLLPTGKFTLVETKEKNERLCKVIGKRLVSKGHFQLNLHDGSNVLTKEKIVVGDSLYLDFAGKIKSHVSLVKGKTVFVISGKYMGQEGKLTEVDEKFAHVHINKMEDTVALQKGQLIAL